MASPQETHARLALDRPADEYALSSEAEAVLLSELSQSAPVEETSATFRIVPGRGSADAHLAALADRGGFDLVVVGQRRRSVIEQIWHGSVARGVLRSAPTNVACVPPPISDARPAFAPPHVVVVGTDFTDASGHALSHALALVVPNGVVHLAHVVRMTASVSDARELRDQALRQLSRIRLGEVTERPVSLEQHLLEGDPAEQLRALSERLGADLLVVGVHRRSTISRALLGSVAQALVETSNTSVLLVPVREI